MKHRPSDALSELLTTGVGNNELIDKIAAVMVARRKNLDSIKKSAVPIREQKKKPKQQNPDECNAELPAFSEFIFALSNDTFCEQSRLLAGT